MEPSSTKPEAAEAEAKPGQEPEAAVAEPTAPAAEKKEPPKKEGGGGKKGGGDDARGSSARRARQPRPICRTIRLPP